MPVRQIAPGKWRYGQTGKVYNSKAKAAAQGRAIRASQAKQGKK